MTCCGAGCGWCRCVMPFISQCGSLVSYRTAFPGAASNIPYKTDKWFLLHLRIPPREGLLRSLRDDRMRISEPGNVAAILLTRLTRVRIPIKLDEDELWLSGKPELLQFSLYHLLGDRPTVGLQILDLAI